jgi:hypothetical protein
MTTRWIAAAATAASVAASCVANAQPKDVNVTKPLLLPAATNSLELAHGGGYTQGFGGVGAGRPGLTDVARPGSSGTLGVGYRVLPQLTLGLYGEFGMFLRGESVDRSTRIYSAAAGLQADWHFLPAGSKWDPWMSFGSGWRGYWLNGDRGTTALQGLQLAKFLVGVEYRISPKLAFGPAIGADLSMFFRESAAQSGSYVNVADPSVNTFVFAGFMGRFSIPLGEGPAARVASQ